MPSYCESRNKTPFDWRGAINSGIAGELDNDSALTVLALDSMKKLSINWTSCACGNLPVEIERTNEGIPTNFILLTYGFLFGTAIHDESWEDALRILDKIESYGKQLIENN